MYSGFPLSPTPSTALNTIGCYVRIVTFLHTQICQCCTSASKSNNKVLRRNLSSAPLVSSDDDGSKHYRKFEDSASDVSSGSSLSKSPSPELEREGDSEEEGGGGRRASLSHYCH